jgi:hypothetical protein
MATLLITFFYILVNQIASIKVDVPRGQPRVAILFVGRSLSNRRLATHGSSSIFDLMTGEEEGTDADRQMFNSSSDPTASDPDVVPGWENTVEMLIEPVKRTHAVDVFVCVDQANGEVPAEVSQVIQVPGHNQEERGANCLSNITGNGRQYDWLIKIRSDYVFYKPFPAMTSFEPGYVYTRFRSAAGITGLTSDHMSYLPCSKRCSGGPSGSIGYVNDDMVRVVPGALMHHAFVDSASDVQDVSMRKNVSSDGTPLLRIPQNWVNLEGRPGLLTLEGKLTWFWLERGILTKPLACPGYPRHDRYGFHGKSLKCALKPVDPVDCPPNELLRSAHKSLCTDNRLDSSRC